MRDATRNWYENMRYLLLRRSNEIGGFLLLVALMLFFIFFLPLLDTQ